MNEYNKKLKVYLKGDLKDDVARYEFYDTVFQYEIDYKKTFVFVSFNPELEENRIYKEMYYYKNYFIT